MKNKYAVVGISYVKSKPIVIPREEFLNHLDLIRSTTMQGAARDIENKLAPIRTDMGHISRENKMLQEELTWLRIQVQKLKDKIEGDEDN